MIPPRILKTFRSLPNDLVGLCRPHTREQLTTPPADGMRSIWDVLVHLAGVEAFWIGHVVLGHPRKKLLPESFKDLNLDFRFDYLLETVGMHRTSLLVRV